MKIKRTKLEYKQIHRSSDWLIVKPLNIKSSLKYGFNTKWCTSSKQDPHVFYKYSREGILIYVIERKTNTKWAVYWEIDEKGKKQDLSWWNSVDDRVDSMLLTIPEDMISKIKKELFLESKPNYFYFTETEKENCEQVELAKERKRKIESLTNPGRWPGITTYRDEGYYLPPDESNYYDWRSNSTLRSAEMEELINKTLYHKYSYEALKDSMTIPYIPKETND
tara:strand:+ start:544 stop:1212 length:669 start_codon:yes stop_codon:yes gene_type:complete